MHSFIYAKAEDGQDYVINHNGDWSGSVEIHLADDSILAPPVAVLPTDLLIHIVGEMVRDYRIRRVESLDSRTLVTLPQKGEPLS